MVIKYVVSHKSPDTDTICSSIMYSKFLKLKGIESKAIKLGNLNNETKFVLEKFEFEVPETKLELEEGSQIILVDHNEESQSIDNRDKYKIVEVIDHHKFDFSTKEPLKIRAEPIGSTCSIVSKMFFENNLELTQNEASILISAIISDTLYFRSPTTTKEDIELVSKLNEIAKIQDLKEYSLKLFERKSDLGDISIEKIIKMDYKTFNISGRKFGIGVMETTSPDFGISRKKEIISKLNEIKEDDNLDFVFLSIVDILNEENLTLFGDDETGNLLKDVFNAELNANIANLKRVLSRKKQIVPKLEEYFSKN